jgi:MFS family permease
LCIVGLLMAALSSSAWGGIFWLSMLGLGVAGFWPTTLACTGDAYPRGGASMYSLLSAAGNIGGIVGPIAIGFVADRIGLAGGMAMLAIAPAVSTAAMLLLLPRRKQPSQR